jgi:mRNA-degrading endonuclease RelE of RelBE toxin-antitoxin system
MDKISKLFKKIGEKDRKALLAAMEKLADSGQRGSLDIKKIEDTDFLRLRQGKFRIIFHYSQKDVIIDSIRMRNESTYNL